MPIYEYEPIDRDCLICQGRLEVLQSPNDLPLKLCPYCGLEVTKVISKASIVKSRTVDVTKAGEKGFTTYKKAEKGVYEKIAGDGPSLIQKGKDFDSKSESDQKPSKVFDID